jgi:uncharacterized protein YegJ (DUF2314 family)
MAAQLAAVVFAFVVVVAIPTALAPTFAQDRVVEVPTDDVEMNTAVETARKTLSDFWAAYEKTTPDLDGFALKVRIEDQGNAEHFWLSDVARAGDKFTGVISNEPQSVANVSEGQTYTFTADQISDWMFRRKGKIVGNHTMRPLLKRMPEEQAKGYRDMLETP